MTSSRRWVLMHELRGEPEPALSELLERLSHCDLVLIEGFKREEIPKLEVHRAANVRAELLFRHDPHVVAIATDVGLESKLPVFGLNDIEAIAGFVLEHAERIAALSPRLVRRAQR